MSWFGVVLLLARLGPLVAIAPFFGDRLPAAVRLPLGLALAVAVGSLDVPAPQAGPLLALALILKELAVGATLGFVASLFFHAAEAAGRIADMAGGLVGLATLYRLLAVVVFFAIGGHRVFVAALARSYQVLPVGEFPGDSGIAGVSALAIRLTAEMLAVALGLCAPVLCATLLADMAAGLLGRFTPDLGQAILALPGRAVATIGVGAAGLLVLVRALSQPFRGATPGVEDLLRLFAR